MKTVILDHAADFDGWREQARGLLTQDIDPSQISWQVANSAQDLFAQSGSVEPVCNHSVSVIHPEFRVPQSFVQLAERVVCHNNPHRFALLYRVLWRMRHGARELMSCSTDDDMHVLHQLAKAVSRDRHKMTAFVRFRQTPDVTSDHYSAWFEPSHHILRLTSPFFTRRFSNMHWSIFTPEGSAHWNTEELVFGPAVSRDTLPQGEIMEDLWRTYFASIFNPARLRVAAMQAEMPVKYWKNLPEAPLIAELVHASGRQTQRMVEAAPTQAPRFASAALNSVNPTINGSAPVSPAVPSRRGCETIEQLKQAARSCRVCAHACDATQTVFGQGKESASVMIVGEQPGDVEDVRGRPFVGPSGKLIRNIIADLSVDEEEIYFTNAVKHFKYTIKGKRRLHQNPSVDEIDHCRVWLSEELSIIKPELIIALGASAARALLGRAVKVKQERGKLQRFGARTVLMITSHPAYVLRSISVQDKRRREMQLRNELAYALESRSAVDQVPLALEG